MLLLNWTSVVTATVRGSYSETWHSNASRWHRACICHQAPGSRQEQYYKPSHQIKKRHVATAEVDVKDAALGHVRHSAAHSFTSASRRQGSSRYTRLLRMGWITRTQWDGSRGQSGPLHLGHPTTSCRGRRRGRRYGKRPEDPSVALRIPLRTSLIISQRIWTHHQR